MQAKYVHTNLVARDWRSLVRFYSDVFGCTFVPPERDYRGDELDAGTGLKNAHLIGAHLRLPGYAEGGPTLEIYQYEPVEPRPAPAVNRPGLGHLAFEVPDVEEARRIVEAHGGSAVGQVVTLATKTGARVTWCYMADPEGNFIELQSWLKD
jgi:predicted enzyme related to lactoylglutathione lyase